MHKTIQKNNLKNQKPEARGKPSTWLPREGLVEHFRQNITTTTTTTMTHADVQAAAVDAKADDAVHHQEHIFYNVASHLNIKRYVNYF